MEETRPPKVYIVVLNFNGWKDTIACLEGVINLRYANFEVVVVDNASADGSARYIADWIRDSSKRRGIPVVLLRNTVNNGYAAGNNAALDLILAKSDGVYIWLLNHDTVVDPDSLGWLVRRAQDYQSKGQRVGIIGSKLLFYHHPEIIQGVGARYNRWLAVPRHIGAFQKDSGQFDLPRLKCDYAIGSALFIDIRFVRDVGLLSEEYFIYWEELDWIIRGRRRGWDIGYCFQSKVYHKEGAVAGTSQRGRRSILSDYYGLRNRIIFTRKFYPYALGSVYLSFIAVIINRIMRGQFGRVKLAYRAMRGRLGRDFVNDYEK